MPGCSRVGDLIPGVLDSGKRLRGDGQGPGKKRSPTNSHRLNRALVELSTSAFKVHLLLWKWRGAPSRGLLPFFTFRSLSRFCNLTRPTVRCAVKELVEKGWIKKSSYNVHHKNSLYRLVPIRDVPAYDGWNV